MKTIGYKDKATGAKGVINCYYIKGQTRHERISKALNELKNMGNIIVYLIDGKKSRVLFSKSY